MPGNHPARLRLSGIVDKGYSTHSEELKRELGVKRWLDPALSQVSFYFPHSRLSSLNRTVTGLICA